MKSAFSARRIPMDRWLELLPSERDGVRLGFLDYDAPSGASENPETDWGWKLLLGRYAHARTVELILHDRELPISDEEREDLEAYHAWVASKSFRQLTKNRLHRISDWVRSYFSRRLSPT
jgi:hypothetical protein